MSDDFTLITRGPHYLGSSMRFEDPIERGFERTTAIERWWQSLYLRLDRVILQLQRISALMSLEATPGQMALFHDGKAA